MLRKTGCGNAGRARPPPKIQLMVRTSNAATLDFYSALGFERQDTVTLGKFFGASDAAQ